MIRILNSIKYSLFGIFDTYKTEPAFRQEIVILCVAFFVVCILDITLFHKLLLVSSILLILIVELMNTAVEAAINRISGKTHPLSKKAKDAGSAAVFLSFINAIFIWVTILLSYEII